MENTKSDSRQDCTQTCEDRFVHCTARMPTGCVEALRLCREACPEKP